MITDEIRAVKCSTCRTVIPPTPPGHTGGTGYGSDRAGHKYCYQCCADKERRFMVRKGRA